MSSKPVLLRESKDLIICDLDMTLVETIFETGIHPSIVNTINELGGVVPDIEIIRSWWYANHDDWSLSIRENFELDAEVFWPAFRHHDTPEFRMQHTRPFPHVIGALQKMQAMRKLLAIITFAKPNITAMEVALLKVRFDKVLSLNGHSEIPDKPEPEGMYHVLDEFGIAKERAVYVGDSNSDGKFANNAEVDFIYFNERGDAMNPKVQVAATFSDWSAFPDLEIKPRFQ